MDFEISRYRLTSYQWDTKTAILQQPENRRFASIVGEFVKKYASRTIGFDGNCTHIMQREDYEARYYILIFVGDYSETTFIGPSFMFENVNIFDLNLTGSEVTENISVGQNLHITAEVEEYNETSGLFFLEPISTEIR